jgi:hypothetical protein
MKTPVLPRAFAVVASVVVTVVLFDWVATMGRSTDPDVRASDTTWPAAYHVALSTR